MVGGIHASRVFRRWDSVRVLTTSEDVMFECGHIAHTVPSGNTTVSILAAQRQCR